MNLALAIAPALGFGIIPAIVMRAGGRPTQQQLGTALGALVFAGALWFALRPAASPVVIVSSFASGVLWSIGMILQFASYIELGTGRAFSLETGIQLVLNAAVGVALFGEWHEPWMLVLGAIALGIIVLGAILAGGGDGKTDSAGIAEASSYRRQRTGGKGLVLAVAASIAFVAYVSLPRFAGAEGADATAPQALGIATAALLASLVDVGRLRRQGERAVLFERTAAWCIVSGVVSGAANLALILSNAANGIAIGFTFSQLAVVVTTLMSILVLREVEDGRTCRRMLAGVAFIVVGAVGIGFTKL